MKNIVSLSLLSLLLFNSCKKEVDIPQSIVENNYSTGAILLDESEFLSLPAAKLNIETSAVLPASVSLNTPPVGNQGTEGSCVAWACAYSARSIEYAQANNQAYYAFDTNIFSPEYVYNQIKFGGCNAGTNVFSALYLMLSQGVCRWDLMPYTSGDCSLQPNEIQKADAAFYKISSWGTVRRNAHNYKTILASGKPIIVAGPINQSFMSLANEAVLGSFTPPASGAHCYVVVGYDDIKKAFKIQNSWGTGWSSAGFGWISYTTANSWWSEAYVIN